MRIGRRLYEEIIARLRAELPREGCGLIVGRGDLALAVLPVANVAAESDGFRLAPAETRAALRGIGDQSVLAIYHSHPTAPPYPSAADRNILLPVRHLIVGFGGRRPESRLFRWYDGFAEERIWILPDEAAG